MMLLIWSGFALGALVWTGSAVVVSALLYWGAGLLASGEAAQLGQMVTSLPVPIWLTYWVDIEAIHAAFDGIAWTLVLRAADLALAQQAVDVDAAADLAAVGRGRRPDAVACLRGATAAAPLRTARGVRDGLNSGPRLRSGM